MKKRLLLIIMATMVLFSCFAVTVSAASSPKLNLKKVTVPANGKNGNGFMILMVTGTTKKVKWSTSNKKIVSISKYNDNKKISFYAKKKGTATITAKVGKKKLKCKVTVTKPMSQNALKKKVKVDTSTMNKQYITITNKSKYYLKAGGRYRIYSPAGEQVDWGDTAWAKLAPGKSQKVYVRNIKGYSQCTFDLDTSNIDYEYHKSNIAVKKKPVVDNYLPIVVTNKSLYKEGVLYVTAFFKDASGNIIWAEETDTSKEPPYDLKPGTSKTVKIYLGNVPAYSSVSIQVKR